MKEDKRFTSFLKEKISITEKMFIQNITDHAKYFHGKHNYLNPTVAAVGLDGKIFSHTHYGTMSFEESAETIADFFVEEALDLIIFSYVTSLDELNTGGDIIEKNNNISLDFISCINGHKNIIYNAKKSGDAIKELYNAIKRKEPVYEKISDTDWNKSNTKITGNLGLCLLAEIVKQYTKKIQKKILK